MIVLTGGMFAGCASPEVVSAGPDTYTVAAGGGLGMTPSSAPVRAAVYKAANQFCAKRGLVMVPVMVDESPGVMGSHTAQVELTFKALRPGDPAIRKFQMVQNNLPAVPGHSLGRMIGHTMEQQQAVNAYNERTNTIRDVNSRPTQVYVHTY